MGRLATAARAVISESLLRNGSLVMLTTLVNGVLGAAFWAVAARTRDDEVVGTAAALLAVIGAASLVANLGLGTVLIDRLPRHGDPHAWGHTVRVALTIGAGASALVGVGGWLLLPVVAEGLRGLPADIAVGATVALGAAATTAALVADSVFVAERRAEHVLFRNVGFGVGKLLLVIVVATGGGVMVILGPWVAALAVSVAAALVIGLRALGRPLPLAAEAPSGGWRRELSDLAPHSMLHHVSNLGAQLPVFALPLVVVARAGPRETAWFTVTWLVAGAFFTVSTAAASSLFAEGAHHPERLDALVRRTGRFVTTLLVPLLTGAVVLGWPILSVFGRGYAREGFPLLVCFVVAAVPDAVTNILIARWRVERRLVPAATVNVWMAAVAVALAWWWVPSLGIAGAGAGWLVAQATGAMAALWVARREIPDPAPSPA